jgi:hypothetical protein
VESDVRQSNSINPHRYITTVNDTILPNLILHYKPKGKGNLIDPEEDGQIRS